MSDGRFSSVEIYYSHDVAVLRLTSTIGIDDAHLETNRQSGRLGLKVLVLLEFCWMAQLRIKAVIFDIGGVVARSPLIAIANYEQQKGLPRDYINCSITSRGLNGAWQRFERGELELLPFYDEFGLELSDTTNGNAWFIDYCRRRKLDMPDLPKKLLVDGRELFGRMMREAAALDENVTNAIRIIRDPVKSIRDAHEDPSSKSALALASMRSRHPESLPDVFEAHEELAFLGWEHGATPQSLRDLFDDFCDSSVLGLRKPDPEFYLLACKRNGVQPRECVFLDDLGMNLKAAQRLGMQTIHVPIGGTVEALRKLEGVLGMELLAGTGATPGDAGRSQRSPEHTAKNKL